MKVYPRTGGTIKIIGAAALSVLKLLLVSHQNPSMPEQFSAPKTLVLINSIGLILRQMPSAAACTTVSIPSSARRSRCDRVQSKKKAIGYSC